MRDNGRYFLKLGKISEAILTYSSTTNELHASVLFAGRRSNEREELDDASTRLLLQLSGEKLLMAIRTVVGLSGSFEYAADEPKERLRRRPVAEQALYMFFSSRNYGRDGLVVAQGAHAGRSQVFRYIDGMNGTIAEPLCRVLSADLLDKLRQHRTGLGFS